MARIEGRRGVLRGARAIRLPPPTPPTKMALMHRWAFLATRVLSHRTRLTCRVRSEQAGADGARPSASQPSTAASAVQRFELDTEIVQRDIQLELIRERSEDVIIVGNVGEQTSAWTAGVRPGARLVGVSDPIQRNQVWSLGRGPSLRFVRDAINMRKYPEIQLDLDVSTSWVDTLPPAPYKPTKAPEATAQAPSASTDRITALDSVLGTDSESDDDGSQRETVAARLEREYRRRQKKTSRIQQRIEKRKSALEQVGTRNDGPFFAAVAAAFLLPAVVILAWAVGSGYLDKLYSQF